MLEDRLHEFDVFMADKFMESFSGVFTAIITPFDSGGKFDENVFRMLIDRQLSAGVSGIVVCGTTGEVATVDADEYFAIVKACIRFVAGRAIVVVGCSSNNTKALVEKARMLQSSLSGIDALLIAAPYYNKPTQEGIYKHYKAVHDAVSMPILLYNVPGRCCVDIKDETTAKIASDLSRVVGTKDATGDLARITGLRLLLKKRLDFSLLSGNDDINLPFYACGGNGCISVLSNVAPSECVKMYDAFRVGDVATARKINDSLFPLAKCLFHESNPIPVKFAMSFLNGKVSQDPRLPLTSASTSCADAVISAIRSAGVTW